MSRPTQWYARIEPALGILREESAELLSRRYIESLLAISTRQANRFMQQVGYAPCDPPQKLFVERKKVIQELNKILGKTEFQEFEERQIHIATQVEKKRLRELASKIQVSFDPLRLGTTLETLPESIKVEKGKVIVEAQSAEDMVGNLYELALAMANNIEQFRAALEGK